MPDSLTLLLYDYVDDIVERRGPHRDAHLAHWRALKEQGAVVMGGALGHPVHGGAFVLRGVDNDAIADLVAADPYVDAGLLTEWRAEPWNVVI
jgi:uncharacterized protein YciI